MEQLSGVMIIIIIGGGVLIFVLLFILAKRQIMRFTLRSRRGPHVPVGNDAKKTLRKEIERRLDCIQRITQEPKLLWTDNKYILQPDKTLPPYHYRMQAVDDIKILEDEIAKNDGTKRHPYENLRAFLLTTLPATLNGSSQRLIHQFCDIYEHARHDPNEFGSEEYEVYQRLLLKLIEAAKLLKAFNNSRKTSPAHRTLKKSTKVPSLLDPSRLKPPPPSTEGIMRSSSDQLQPQIKELSVGQQTKVNLTLGLQGRDTTFQSLPTDTTGEIVANPLHYQIPTERDSYVTSILRSRLKTPSMDEHQRHEPIPSTCNSITDETEQDKTIVGFLSSTQHIDSNLNTNNNVA